MNDDFGLNISKSVWVAMPVCAAPDLPRFPQIWCPLVNVEKRGRVGRPDPPGINLQLLRLEHDASATLRAQHRLRIP